MGLCDGHRQWWWVVAALMAAMGEESPLPLDLDAKGRPVLGYTMVKAG